MVSRLMGDSTALASAIVRCCLKYYEGLPYLNDFYMEVHYEGTSVQDESIQRVLAERGKTVYATAVRAGAILVDNGNLKLLGDVKIFR